MSLPENRMKPLFCYSIFKSTFYNIINIIDIYRFFFVICTALLTFALHKHVNSTLILSSLFILTTSVVAYVFYYLHNDFRETVHKFYSITRMFYTVPDTIMTYFLYLHLMERGFKSRAHHGRFVTFIMVSFFLALSSFNFYWNVLFIKLTFEKKPEIDEKEELVPIEEDKAVSEKSVTSEAQIEVPSESKATDQHTVAVEMETEVEIKA